MALILTFLGKGGCGCSTLAVAMAKKLASEGSRVLLGHSRPDPRALAVAGASLDLRAHSLGG
jgi:anion-transporting  ArsA/GET3 family ATPase